MNEKTKAGFWKSALTEGYALQTSGMNGWNDKIRVSMFKSKLPSPQKKVGRFVISWRKETTIASMWKPMPVIEGPKKTNHKMFDLYLNYIN